MKIRVYNKGNLEQFVTQLEYFFHQKNMACRVVEDVERGHPFVEGEKILEKRGYRVYKEKDDTSSVFAPPIILLERKGVVRKWTKITIDEDSIFAEEIRNEITRYVDILGYSHHIQP